jgi:heme-degrading monooxygenase HmoA
VILEYALLQVRDGEAAMAVAKPLIAASTGFLGIEVRPAAERPGLYLFMAQWESIAHHRDGFRTSDRYQEWRALLHPFYDPMPEVQYFGDPS